MNSLNMKTKMDFWIEQNLNVMFYGKHGVGKTAMIKEAFDRHNLNWRYFSASTMDPWVDFVGVPKEKYDLEIPSEFRIIRELAKINQSIALNWIEKNWHLSNSDALEIYNYATSLETGPAYLDLVRPKVFATGEIEALFLDEYNRSVAKVRNAVMELIQFKSLNGFKFPKLKFVWVAVNPKTEDDTYDVDEIDPAQEDRFHIKVEVPYRPNVDWFRHTYGKQIADSAIDWWDQLPDTEKKLVSPRRLQYALDVYTAKGDVRDVLESSTNVGKLISNLNSGPITDRLTELMKNRDAQETRTFLQNENNFAAAMRYIPKSEAMMSYFLPLCSKEKIAALINEDDNILNHVINKSEEVPLFIQVCKQIMDTSGNNRVAKKIRRALTDNPKLAEMFANEGEK